MEGFPTPRVGCRKGWGRRGIPTMILACKILLTSISTHSMWLPPTPINRHWIGEIYGYTGTKVFPGVVPISPKSRRSRACRKVASIEARSCRKPPARFSSSFAVMVEPIQWVERVAKPPSGRVVINPKGRWDSYRFLSRATTRA